MSVGEGHNGRSCQGRKSWIRYRSDPVKITTGKFYAGNTGTIESNVYQRIVHYPDEFANRFRILLNTVAVLADAIPVDS